VDLDCPFPTTFRTSSVLSKDQIRIALLDSSVYLYELHGEDLSDANGEYDFLMQGGIGDTGPEHFSSLSFQICTYSTCPYSC
jgi:hypothetical protein